LFNWLLIIDYDLNLTFCAIFRPQFVWTDTTPMDSRRRHRHRTILDASSISSTPQPSIPSFQWTVAMCHCLFTAKHEYHWRTISERNESRKWITFYKFLESQLHFVKIKLKILFLFVFLVYVVIEFSIFLLVVIPTFLQLHFSFFHFTVENSWFLIRGIDPIWLISLFVCINTRVSRLRNVISSCDRLFPLNEQTQVVGSS